MSASLSNLNPKPLRDAILHARRCNRIDKLNQSGLALHIVDPEKSRELAEEALEWVALTEQDGDLYLQGRAESQALLSIYNYTVGRFGEALRVGNPAVNTLRAFEMSPFLPPLVGAIGATLSRVGQYSDAAAHFREMLSISISQGDVASEARAHVGMGMVYGETGRQRESLEATKLALIAYERLQDVERQTLIYSNMSYAYIHLGQFETALETALKGLDLSETLEQRPFMGLLLNNIGVAYHELGDEEMAQVYLNKALKHGQEKEDVFLVSSINFTIAETFTDRGQPQRALPYLQTAADLARANNYTALLARVHREQSKAHRALGDFEMALTYFEQFYELHSSAFNDTNATKLAVLEIKYQTEVAERKAELMEEMNQVLEQRVAERTEALWQALDRELSLSEQLKTALDAEARLSTLRAQIITVVSHEFRTPLTVIGTSADLLARAGARLPETRKEKQFGNIRDSLTYLTALLDDIILLDLVNSAEPTLELSTIPCIEFLNLIEQYATETFPNRSFAFSYPSNVVGAIKADQSYISTLISKLINNAVVYSDADTTIHFSATQTAEAISIKIEDNGIGFSEQDAVRLLEPFFRGENVETRRGIGLGLTIAKSIVEAIGGDISAESPGVGMGSTVMFSLPLLPVVQLP